MPLARLAQYQQCLLRQNGVRTTWSGTAVRMPTLREQLGQLRTRWTPYNPQGVNDPLPKVS